MATTWANYASSLTNYSASVYYKEVTEYQENITEPAKPAGKTVYKYNHPAGSIASFNVAGNDYYQTTFSYYALPKIPEFEFDILPADRFGQLEEKYIYKREGTNYGLIQSEINTYTIQQGEDLSSLQVYRYASYSRDPLITADFERLFIENPAGHIGFTLPYNFQPFQSPPPDLLYVYYPVGNFVVEYTNHYAVFRCRCHGYYNELPLYKQ